MNHDFLNLLQEKTPGFSKGQRRIAQYIMEAYDKAAFMTASRPWKERGGFRVHRGAFCGGFGL